MAEGSGWNVEGIRAEQRQKWVDATAGWTADELREKLVEVAAGIYPISYVLSHLIDNPDIPHGGMTVVSDLFPFHVDELDDAPGAPENYGSKYDVESKQWVAVPIKWGEPKAGGYSHDEVSFAAGETLHESFTVLSIWQYATAASINCGSFNTNDIERLCKAISAVKSSD